MAKETVLSDSSVLYKVLRTLYDNNNLEFKGMDLGCTLHYACSDDQIKDMLGFISWCLNNNEDGMYILANIGHDLNGLKREYLNEENGFSPRSYDHKKYIDLAVPVISENLTSSIR